MVNKLAYVVFDEDDNPVRISKKEIENWELNDDSEYGGIIEKRVQLCSIVPVEEP